MEIIAKAIMVTMGAVVLICGAYVGLRTANDPIWYVQ